MAMNAVYLKIESPASAAGSGWDGSASDMARALKLHADWLLSPEADVRQSGKINHGVYRVTWAAEREEIFKASVK